MSIKRETVEERKALPLATGVLDYFPDALLAVAEVSRVGNEQHHPGAPLHWDKSKSSDEADALLRHLVDRGTRDVDGMRHSAKVAWRALAMLQRELDAEAADRVPTYTLAAIEQAVQQVYTGRTPEEEQALIDAWNKHKDDLGTVRVYSDPDSPRSYPKPEAWGTGDGPIIHCK